MAYSLRVFIFATIIAHHGKQITAKISEHCFDFGVKGQGRIYLVLKLVTRTPLSFLTECVHI